MCLASVYGKQNDTETLIMKNVTRVEVREDKVYLYDIIGKETVVEGKLTLVDLTRSIVQIECPA
ncbi:MAG: CooT family nickel-binding protein [Lachnospiraceae bacterium]|jgi:predicted RNA-binding protein|nr:CooT family nickel-binding protein [Lachnospiraceae bacterium]MBQ6875553.1 CooT family nickel-binding protein [Lachnospiraceae bacterium]